MTVARFIYNHAKFIGITLGVATGLVCGTVLGKATVWASETGSSHTPDSFITAEQMTAKDAAVTQCHMEQREPVMGFGLKVVCLKPEGGIAWTR